MRILATFAAAALLAPAIAPAQPAQPVEQRVRRLEGEMRAVQRRVFPNGAPATPDAPAGPAPASQDSVVDITARVNALEGSFRTLTGQVEELENRIRQLEARAPQNDLGSPQPVQPTPVAPTPEPTAEPQATTPNPIVSSEVETPAPASQPAVIAPAEPLPSDPAEAAYVSGFRLYQAGQHDAAIETLQAMAKKYPRHAKASWATNLAGRAHLAAGRPATAAELFFSNYQGNPRGERAPDSLFYLGESLVKLDKRDQACKVYDELESVYGRTLRAQLRAELPAARRAARCT